MSPDINKSLNQFLISFGITLIKIFGHSAFHDFNDTFDKEEIAVLEFVLPLIMSKGSQTIKVSLLGFVRPVSCCSEEFFSETYSLIIGSYPLVEKREC